MKHQKHAITSNIRKEKLNLLHVNAADFIYKMKDLKNKMKYFNSHIVSLQETHFRKKENSNMTSL